MNGDWGWVEGAQRVSPSDTGQISGFWGLFLTNDSTGPSVKGSWRQLVSAVPFDVVGMLAEMRISDQAGTALVDLSVGASSSEQLLVPNLHMRRGGSNDITALVYLPVRVAAGERIAGRYSYDDASNFSLNVRVRLHLLAAAINSPYVQSRCATYGANTTTSKGTAVDPGASAYTKSAWVELTSSTDFDCNHVLLTVNEGGSSLTASPGTQPAFVDIGIGGSGSEQILVQDYHFPVSTGTRADMTRLAFPISIPAGTRVAVRMASGDSNSATRPKEFSMTIFG